MGCYFSDQVIKDCDVLLAGAFFLPSHLLVSILTACSKGDALDALWRDPCGKESRETSDQQPNKEINPTNNHLNELGSGSIHDKPLDGLQAQFNSLNVAL